MRVLFSAEAIRWLHLRDVKVMCESAARPWSEVIEVWVVVQTAHINWTGDRADTAVSISRQRSQLRATARTLMGGGGGRAGHHGICSPSE